MEIDFKADKGLDFLDPVSLEAGEGGASRRMTGQGHVQIAEPARPLKLEGSPPRRGQLRPPANGQDSKSLPRVVDPKLSCLSTLPEDRQHRSGSGGSFDARARLSFHRGQAKIDLFEFTAPGEICVAMEGKASLGTRGEREGKVGAAIEAIGPFRLLSHRLNLLPPSPSCSRWRALCSSSDVAFVSPVVCLPAAREDRETPS